MHLEILLSINQYTNSRCILIVMYKKLALSKLATVKQEWWFQELADYITKQSEKAAPYDFDYARVKTMPKEVQAVFFVWWFSCEAGGSGFEGYLMQSAGLHAQEAHAGLTQMGATELVERLEAAIPLSFEWSPEYSFQEDHSWYSQFPRNTKYPNIESIDTPETYDLIGDDLRDKANIFIKNNLDIFADKNT